MSSPQRKVWFDGFIVPEREAVLPIGSAAVKYGANVFEGIVAYAGREGRNIFRLQEHLERLRHSARLMRIDGEVDLPMMAEIVQQTLVANDDPGDCHIRLTVFVAGSGYSDVTGPALVTCVAAQRKASTLHERSCTALVSSWRRIEDDVLPPRIKSGANYMNSRLGLLEARRGGADEAVFLTRNGKVSEAANSCILMVRGGRLVAPPVTSALLESVTRATLLELGRHELGLEIEEREVDRTELNVAEEVFLCGSGHEVRPILRLDGLDVGTGAIGPVTGRLWEAYDATTRGARPERTAWLTPVRPAQRKM